MSRPKPWLLAALGAIVVTVLALVVAAALSGPGRPPVHVEPQVTFALPPASAGCGGTTTLPGGGAHVPLTVSTVAGQVAESVNVCIAGQGPFPFVLDSGAGQSTIDAGLAKRLHLAAAGPSTSLSGVGCTGAARPVSVGSWSVEGLSLSPQELTSATLPQVGGKGEPDGLLGADVLSRFGAVRVDFASGALILPGPEGQPLGGSEPRTGPTGPPPAALTGGQGTAIPATVNPQEGEVSLGVDVRFAGGPRRQFVVDTGSSQSVVSTTVAQSGSLQPSDLAQRQATVCSVITVPLVHSGPWSLSGQPLHAQLLGETGFGTIGLSGIEGLLGSDQLKRFGWMVLDYRGGRLVLG